MTINSPLTEYVVNASTLMTKKTVSFVLSQCGLDAQIPGKGQQTIVSRPGFITVVIRYTDQKSPDGKRLYEWMNLVKLTEEETRS